MKAIGTHKTKTANTNSSQRLDDETNDPAEFLNQLRSWFEHSQYFGSWIQSNGRWWFKHNDGSYTSDGWEKIDGVWYHFDSLGWMQTGWVKDGSWYYLDGSGAMKTGWLKDNGSWYYLDSSGAMKTGWMKVSGKWYYAYSSGALAINTTTPDGYRVNYNGEWV